MTISPLWISILLACLLAVPLLLRVAGVRAEAIVPRKRLAFDDRADPAVPGQEAHTFRLGRLSLTEPGADRPGR